MGKTLNDRWDENEDILGAKYFQLITAIDNAITGKTFGVVNQIGEDFSLKRSFFEPQIFKYKKDKELVNKVVRSIKNFKNALNELTKTREQLLELQKRIKENK